MASSRGMNTVSVRFKDHGTEPDCYADQLELDVFAELRKSLMITRRRHQADQYKAIDVGPFPIEKGRTL